MTLTDTIKELRGLLDDNAAMSEGHGEPVFSMYSAEVAMKHLPTLLEAAERAEQWQQMHDSVQQTNAALVKKLTYISERAERYELALYVLGPAAASYLEAIDKKMEWFAVDARRDFLLSGLAEFRKAIAQPLQPTPPPASKVCGACRGVGQWENLAGQGGDCPDCDGTGKEKAFREGGE